MENGTIVHCYKVLLGRCLALHTRALTRVFKGMLEFYWDLGCGINHALNHGRSEYGASTIARLSEDLPVVVERHPRLRECRQRSPRYPGEDPYS